MRYPETLSEQETLDRVLAGASLARYGDGEFKLIRGGGIKSQQHEPALGARLREILVGSTGRCLVGIPNLRSETPKADFWSRYESAAALLSPGRCYGSSFITRPDSAPWIDRVDYWEQVQSLWRGLEVTLVRGSSKSLTAERLVGAGDVREIIAPRQHAWAEYQDLLVRIGHPDRVLLCLGPTATVLAVDLCRAGVHAVDLGHIGMFLEKHRRGEPMWVTQKDRAA